MEECNSLKKLSLTSNNCEEQHENDPYHDTFDRFLSYINSTRKKPVTWLEGLRFGLAITSSLKELNMTVNNIACTDSSWRDVLYMGLPENKSVTSLTVTISDYKHLGCKEWIFFLKICLAKNKSLTTLTLTVNNYSEGERYDGFFYQVTRDNVLPENTSLTDLNLTVNIRREVTKDWLPIFCDCFMMKCSSLRTVRLQVNDRCATSKSRLYDLSELRLKYRSLSTFELSVTFYGE